MQVHVGVTESSAQYTRNGTFRVAEDRVYRTSYCWSYVYEPELNAIILNFLSLVTASKKLIMRQALEN